MLDAPDVESVLITFSRILIAVDVLEQVIPVTFPPVPVDERLLIVLGPIVIRVALLAKDPIVIPVTPAC